MLWVKSLLFVPANDTKRKRKKGLKVRQCGHILQNMHVVLHSATDPNACQLRGELGPRRRTNRYGSVSSSSNDGPILSADCILLVLQAPCEKELEHGFLSGFMIIMIQIKHAHECQ